MSNPFNLLNYVKEEDFISEKSIFPILFERKRIIKNKLIIFLFLAFLCK